MAIASKPNIKEFMDATGVDFLTASNTLYGNIGANIDARDWGAIMSSSNPLAAATQATASMYSDPAYQQSNTANLITQGYDPAQAYYTYGQMNERVGANYTPTADEVSAVETYFKDSGQPDYIWNVPKSSATTPTVTIQNAYFAANPDVAAAYANRFNDPNLSSTVNMTPDEFAAAHYQAYGQSEGRVAPTTMAPDIVTLPIPPGGDFGLPATTTPTTSTTPTTTPPLYDEVSANTLRELFPSFAKSKQLATQMVASRPTTAQIISMIQGGNSASQE